MDDFGSDQSPMQMPMSPATWMMEFDNDQREKQEQEEKKASIIHDP